MAPSPLEDEHAPLFTVGQVAEMLAVKQAFLRRVDELRWSPAAVGRQPAPLHPLRDPGHPAGRHHGRRGHDADSDPPHHRLEQQLADAIGQLADGNQAPRRTARRLAAAQAAASSNHPTTRRGRT